MSELSFRQVVQEEAYRIFGVTEYRRTDRRWYRAQGQLYRTEALKGLTWEKAHGLIQQAAQELWFNEKERDAAEDWRLAEENVLRPYGWTPERFWAEVRKEAYLIWCSRVSENVPGSQGDDWLRAEKLTWECSVVFAEQLRRDLQKPTPESALP